MQTVGLLLIGILILGGISAGVLIAKLLELKALLLQIRSAIPAIVKTQNTQIQALTDINNIVSKGSLPKAAEARLRVVNQIAAQLKEKTIIEEDN